MQSLRTMLSVFLSCLWLGSGAFAHASSPSMAFRNTKDNAASYGVRRREAAIALDKEQKEHRDLLDLFPAFSEDEATVETKMPRLTLLLRGLDGDPLGEKSYDAVRTAMNDYLRKRFEDYFLPRYEFQDSRSNVVKDVFFEDATSGGNALLLETYLSFSNPNYEPEKYDETEIGPRTRAHFQPSFRLSDSFEPNSNSPEAEAETRNADSGGVPSDLELEFAAGYAWNDLTLFRNHLLVAVTIEGLSTFDGMDTVDSLETFPTNAQTADEIAVAEEEQEKEEESKPQQPQRGDVTSPSGGSLNVAAASSSLTESGTDRMNPLWPALIVGIAVFLFTIIILGYRKHRSRGYNKFDKSKGGKDENIMIHVINDTSTTLEGDEEIEVEDTLYTSPNSSPNRKQRERDLDKQYAASCLKPVLSSISKPSTSAISDDEDDEGDGLYERDASRRSCLKGRRRRSNRRSLQEQDSMAYDSHDSRGIDLPRRVDLTTPPDRSSWRNPAQLHEEGDSTYDNGDMTKKERKRFAKYMESGLTIEEASSQIMNERNAKSRTRSIRGGDQELVPPSSMAKTRSGNVAGYTNSGHRGSPQRKEQSDPMGCFNTEVCGGTAKNEETYHAEIMNDGTAVHYVNKPAKDPNLLQGLQDDGDRRIDGTARAMVITQASSHASSYDDDDFDRAMEEAAAVETAFV